MSEQAIPDIDKGVYRHYKNRQLYEVLGVALQTETGEPLVIYRPLYDTQYELFARPYEMFTGKVAISDTEVLRFVKQDLG